MKTTKVPTAMLAALALGGGATLWAVAQDDRAATSAEVQSALSDCMERLQKSQTSSTKDGNEAVTAIRTSMREVQQFTPPTTWTEERLTKFRDDFHGFRGALQHSTATAEARSVAVSDLQHVLTLVETHAGDGLLGELRRCEYSSGFLRAGHEAQIADYRILQEQLDSFTNEYGIGQ